MDQREHDLLIELEKSLIHDADAVSPISRSIAETMCSEYGIEADHRWRTNYIGIRYWPEFDVNSEYDSIGGSAVGLDAVPTDSFKMLFIGRLELRKGVDVLLEATKRLLQRHRNAVLVLAGEDRQDWQKIANSMLGRTDSRRVYFLGQVENTTKEKLLSSADLLVFPSRYESFGLVPLEAFVHGLPVVASRSGAAGT